MSAMSMFRAPRKVRSSTVTRWRCVAGSVVPQCGSHRFDMSAGPSIICSNLAELHHRLETCAIPSLSKLPLVLSLYIPSACLPHCHFTNSHRPPPFTLRHHKSPQIPLQPANHTHPPTSIMTHTYKFNIAMSCGGCSGAVDRVLKKLDGELFPRAPLCPRMAE
jgi:hypothetical protein